MHRHLVVVVIIAVAGTGCATRGSVSRLHGDLAALRTEVTDLRDVSDGAIRESARLEQQVRALDTRVTELKTGESEMREQVARTAARADAAEAALRDTRAEVERLRTAAAPPPTPTPPAAPAPETERGRETARRTGSAEQLYANALATFRAGEHGQAVLEFVDFIARHPRHTLVPNAQYWIGEAYYGQRDYRQAAVEFQKVLEHGTSHPKAPDALLKLGLAYSSLRDRARARQTWQRVVRDYASSPAATKARAFLRNGGATVR